MDKAIFQNAKKFSEYVSKISPDERERISEKNLAVTEQSYKEFLSKYNANICYLCNKSFASFSKIRPCIHWFLKPKGMKKQDILLVAKKYSFLQIQTYLRWLANQEGIAKHINDLSDDINSKNIIDVTIRYKKFKWSFVSSENDYKGHENSQHSKFPHYHLQILEENKPILKFNDLHIPFQQNDILSLEAQRNNPDIFKIKFPFGEGMSDFLNNETVDLLVENSKYSAGEEDSTLSLDTMVYANDGSTIKGEDLYNIIQEAKNNNVSIASLIHKLPNSKSKVIVSPGPGVVDQAQRSGRK